MQRNFDKLKYGFFSLLLKPGSIVWHKDDRPPLGMLRYVMGTNHTCATVVRAVPTMEQGKRLVNIQREDGSVEGGELIISNPNSWRCSTVEALPPMCNPKLLPYKVVLVAQPGEVTILRLAAEEGFARLTLVHCNELVDYLGLEFEGARPTLLHDVLRALIQHCIDGISPADIDGILARRKNIGRTKLSQYLDHDIDIDMDDVHADDVAEVQKEVEELRKSKAAHALHTGAKPKPKPRAAPKRLKPVEGFKGVFSLEVLKAYLPKVHGCKVSIESEWDPRIRMTYPRDSPPWGTSMTFAKAGSERSAILFCLRWVWGEHLEATGQPCPFDLD